MPFFYLPKPVYEALPAAYGVVGLSTAFWSNNAIGLMAGLLLAVAGWHIRAVRKSARKEQAALQSRMEGRLRRARQSRTGWSQP